MKIFNLKTADFVVVSILALFICWYAWSAWQTSSTVENMILIVPIAAIALVLTVGEIIQQIRRNATDISVENTEEKDSVFTVLPIIGLFTVYVMSLETIGFDVATTLFVAAFLWYQKERRLVWLIGYSVVFGLIMSVFFAQMLPYPMPMSLLPTEY
ncbi:tripartite tricarboxylate transporter TctB family protein [Vibrio algarum]|uniref:Tripartite tricarboxylate transporter TctB family protein n=1 Tax=Vibrio algarum TaxID=3020714 RepID=A0ABT4YU52_9VIBR|nr:tripartite tricarboxylate transporter TctB family protein [Vibrio sp. KJ40-1]MDB1125105.1 tripartite tricarboxylate transporter TctB family protein [Vibrio sp. KJ40-1]